MFYKITTFLFIFVLISNSIFATELPNTNSAFNENITENTMMTQDMEETNTQNSKDTIDEEDTLPDTTESSSKAPSTKVTGVSPLAGLPEANLGLNNVLNIILIAIGFLLILFAIAILIRLKK